MDRLIVKYQILLLNIWIPHYEFNIKIILTAICIGKFMLYFQKNNIIALAISVILMIVFESVVITSQMWLSAIIVGMFLIAEISTLIDNVKGKVKQKYNEKENQR